MRVLVLDPPPELIARRKELGQDGYDEVWDGVYHLVPMARGRHGWLQLRLARVLDPSATSAGLTPMGPFNLGDGPDNFRVPDMGLLRNPDLDDLYFGSAAVVVEVVSPRDETFEKFDFYAAHDVDEIIVVDPDTHTVRIFLRDGVEYSEAVASSLLGVIGTELASELNWG